MNDTSPRRFGSHLLGVALAGAVISGLVTPLLVIAAPAGTSMDDLMRAGGWLVFAIVAPVVWLGLALPDTPNDTSTKRDLSLATILILATIVGAWLSVIALVSVPVLFMMGLDWAARALLFVGAGLLLITFGTYKVGVSRAALTMSPSDMRAAFSYAFERLLRFLFGPIERPLAH